MTRNHRRDSSVMTDVKLAAASALVTAFAILLANATPAWDDASKGGSPIQPTEDFGAIQGVAGSARQ